MLIDNGATTLDHYGLGWNTGKSEHVAFATDDNETIW